jgi:hypothetical protein
MYFFAFLKWHIICHNNAKQTKMEKRIVGFILTLLGVTGLVVAGYFFMHGGQSTVAMKSITLYGILGFVFFIAGVSLVRNTKDKAT